MMNGIKFAQPYFVSPHAVKRFQERVVNIPAERAILVVQAALQVKKQPAWSFKMRDGRLCWVYQAKYAGIPYYIPVARQKRGHGDKDWPIVPTILGPDMGPESKSEYLNTKEELNNGKQ